MFSQRKRLFTVVISIAFIFVAFFAVQNRIESQVIGGSGQAGVPVIPSLTIKESIPSSKLWPVEKNYLAVFTAEVTIPTAVASGVASSTGPAPAPNPPAPPVPLPGPSVPVPISLSWSWAYVIQFEEAPGEWNTAPKHSFTLKPKTVNSADSTTSILTLDVLFHKPGEWRIVGIQATVATQSGSSSSIAVKSANSIHLTAVKVSISPRTIPILAGDLVLSESESRTGTRRTEHLIYNE